MKTPAEVSSELVNGWLEETAGYPVTLQLARLGIRIAEKIELAYKEMRHECAMTAETFPEGFAVGSKIAQKIRSLEIPQ